MSNASHELKTPLATMKIMLESMIYQPDMPAEVREDFMKDMNHEIDRLTGIVTDLLVLTRLDNRGEMKRDTVNMSELTHETIHLLTPAAEQNRQTLAGDVQEDLFLYGDRSKLSQILYNLMDNAIKYTPEEGSVHRETGGTGLGLSIVKQMVKMHDGTISVHSIPGQGSEFVVVFPQEGADS